MSNATAIVSPSVSRPSRIGLVAPPSNKLGSRSSAAASVKFARSIPGRYGTPPGPTVNRPRLLRTTKRERYRNRLFNRNARIKEDMTNPHSAFYTIFEYMDRTIRILMLIKTFAPERAKRRPILAGRLLKESTLHLRHALAI